jgi:hypothetical protein
MRDKVQPGIALAEFMRHVDALIQARSVDDIFLRLEQSGSISRVDPNVIPSKWRCATISVAELTALRRIRDIVRRGRVRRLTADRIELDQGTVATDRRTLHVDCTANGLARKAPQPLFAPRTITLQSVFMCQQVFSAAIIARLEQLDMDDTLRNAVCEVVPHPESSRDHPTTMLASFRNLLSANRHMPFWLRRNRLNLLHHETLHRYLIGAATLYRRLPRLAESVERMLATSGRPGA